MILNWLSYPRAVFLALFGLGHTFVMSIVILGVAASTSKRRVVDWFINYIWSYPLLFFSGAKVEVRGRENVAPDGKGFLILFNHSSLMDIPLLYFYFPRSFRFGAKIELFKIPFFGKAMELCGVLPIDRGNRSKVMKVYENAISRVNNGEAFALAPEGTRQKEARLGKFKRGPFEFGINAQMDLIPVVVAGAYDLLPKKSFLPGAGQWRHKVILQILPRVPTQGLKAPDDIEPLVATVQSEMDEVYVRLNSEI